MLPPHYIFCPSFFNSETVLQVHKVHIGDSLVAHIACYSNFVLKTQETNYQTIKHHRRKIDLSF